MTKCQHLRRLLRDVPEINRSSHHECEEHSITRRKLKGEISDLEAAMQNKGIYESHSPVASKTGRRCEKDSDNLRRSCMLRFECHNVTDLL